MSGIWVVLAYGAALALAVFLLFWFKPQAWYWHVLSAAGAFGLGLMTPRPEWQGPVYDVLLGAVFILMFVWGLGGVLLYRTHHEKRA